jgi:glycosyltransferase involved in cell wall biosynthesis
MKLVAITDCIHYKKNGCVYNMNPILTKQLDFFFKYFDDIILVAPITLVVHEEISLITYNKDNLNKIKFISTEIVGGNSLKDKLKIIFNLYNWLKLFWEIRNKDLFYLRFPNNLNIVSFLLYHILRKKIIITYTGTWENYKNEPIWYRVQKMFIKYLHRGPAFVYSLPNSLPYKNIFSSFSPSFTNFEWMAQKARIAEKIRLIKSGEVHKIQFVTVGSVIDYKNQLLAIKIVQYLFIRGINAILKIIGSGGDYLDFLRRYVAENSLQEIVLFEGFKVGSELDEIYNSGHFLIHTPIIEGYGKTPQEGLFYGLIPILSEFPFSSFFTGSSKERGFIVNEQDLLNDKLFIGIESIIENKDIWEEFMIRCFEFSNTITLDFWAEDYLNEIKKMQYEK